MKNCRYIISVMSVAAMVMLVVACSTKKNTAQSRWWQSFNTRYNVYYNGAQAYIDASLEKEKGNKDNYTELLPLYTVGNKASKDLGKGNYDKAIEKAKKAIKLHSITAKPKWTKSRAKNEKEIEYYSRHEYNPFLWKAWMLMGRSQFYQGNFDDAASTFAWMARQYKTQPAIYGKARAWLAKSYIEQDWIYDAEDVIRNMQRDSIDWRAQKEWDYTLADYYLHTDDKAKACEYLRKVVKHEQRSAQRAREWYIIGQLEAAQNNRKAAYKAFKKVVAQNPPYELAFNARISMTEVLAQGQAKKMIGKLKRMARNDNNKDYLDQVYYAIGNIYLAQKDTVNAISAYEKGNEKATRSGIEKGVLLLHLGDLYWQLEKYGDAQRCYGEAIGLLDKERPDYKQISDRSKVLDELVPYTDGIYLQDSLQALAKMDEKSRNEAIDRVIDELKRKEKEERDKEAEAAVQAQQQKYGNQSNNQRRTPTTPAATSNNKQQTFYFYNAQAVQQGKQAFQRQWGKRDNADDWQRINKTVVNNLLNDEDDTAMQDTATVDSTANTQILNDSIAVDQKDNAEADSAANDPHKREYYLAQIPFTEEQVAASNEIIKEGLFRSGIIFKDKLDNLPLSEKQFMRLNRQFPEFEPKDEVYYHLFLLHSRKGDEMTAKAYVDSLMNSYPDSKWTTVVTDPYFEENARFGKHIEDSLYTATYEAFLADKHEAVMANTHISDTRFIMGDNRDKFLFISGLSMLNNNQPDSCLSHMEKVVKDYPKSSVATIAGMIINGVKEGKKLRGANFSMADVWDRRSAVMSDVDSLAEKKLTDERNIPYVYMYVYNPDSLNENQLLYQMAKFNFTTFVARNFELNIDGDNGLNRMQVTGFRDFDEAKQYMHVLYSNNEAIKSLTKKARAIIISEENLPLLGTQYSYNDYDSFYVEHFQPLAVEHEYMLYEPDVTPAPKARQASEDESIAPALPSDQAAPGGATPVEPKQDDDESADPSNDGESIDISDNGNDIIIDNSVIVNDVIQTDSAAANGIIIDDKPAQQQQNADDGIIIIDNTQTQQNANDEFIIIDDTQTQQNAGNEFIIVDDKQAQPQSANDEIIIIDGKQTQQNTNGKQANGKQANQQQQPQNATNGIIIIDPTASTTDDVEDEYYELDGF